METESFRELKKFIYEGLDKHENELIRHDLDPIKLDQDLLDRNIDDLVNVVIDNLMTPIKYKHNYVLPVGHHLIELILVKILSNVEFYIFLCLTSCHDANQQNEIIDNEQGQNGTVDNEQGHNEQGQNGTVDNVYVEGSNYIRRGNGKIITWFLQGLLNTHFLPKDGQSHTEQTPKNPVDLVNRFAGCFIQDKIFEDSDFDTMIVAKSANKR